MGVTKRKRKGPAKALNTQVGMDPPSKDAPIYVLVGTTRIAVQADSIEDATARLRNAVNHPTTEIIFKRCGLRDLQIHPKRYGLVGKAKQQIKRLVTRDTRILGPDNKPIKGGS